MQKSRLNHIAARLYYAFDQQDLSGQWESFSKQIDTHTLNYLAIVAELLQTRSRTSLLDAANLSSVREQLDSALIDVIESNYDSEIKSYLSHSIRRIITAIDEYHITGVYPIADAIESTVGHTVLDSEFKEFMVSSDLGNRIFEILVALASCITIAVGAPQLPETIRFFLGAPK